MPSSSHASLHLFFCAPLQHKGINIYIFNCLFFTQINSSYQICLPHADRRCGLAVWTTGRAQARAFCSAPHLSLRLVLVPPAAPLSLSSRLVSATATATASRGIGASERARARGLVFSLDPFRFVVVDDEPSPRRDGDFVSAGQVRARSKRHAPCMQWRGQGQQPP